MSEFQKEAARSSLTGRAFNFISPIFDDLPERFTTREVMKKGRLPRQLDGAVKNVLYRVFKCIEVGNLPGHWKKP